MIFEDKFLSVIIGKNSFKIDNLSKSVKLQKNSFYTYEFEYNEAKISQCNKFFFSYVSSRVELCFDKNRHLKIKKFNKNYLPIIISQKFEKKYLKDINKICSLISKTSRFYKDIHLKKYASKVYKNWGNNSFLNGYIQDYFLAKNKDDEIIGLITLKVKDSECVIDLMGVLENYQNQNVGSMLMKSVFKKYKDYNISVGTQAENIKALSFYLKNNFKILKNILIYHKHT